MAESSSINTDIPLRDHNLFVELPIYPGIRSKRSVYIVGPYNMREDDNRDAIIYRATNRIRMRIGDD